jgi:hypothetical protein
MAVLPDGRVVLLRQFRPAAGETGGGAKADAGGQRERARQAIQAIGQVHCVHHAN